MKTLVDKLKGGVKAVRKAAVIGAVSLGIGAALLGGEAKGATEIYSFDDLIPGVGNGSGSVRMDYGDNLMVRDPNTEMESVAGMDGSVWRMGLVKYVPEGMIIGGFANNDKGINTFPGYEGFMGGLVYNANFPDGSRVEDVMIAHDPDGGRMALLYANGALVFDENISLYFTEDIEFNGFQGDLNQLPTITYGNTSILPHMVVNPATGPVLREGPYDMNDLADLSSYWLSGCDEGNNYCEGLDFSGDGTVNFKDFAYVANDWSPSIPVSASSSSISSAQMSANVYSTVQNSNGVYEVDGVDSSPYMINQISVGDNVVATIENLNGLEDVVSE